MKNTGKTRIVTSEDVLLKRAELIRAKKDYEASVIEQLGLKVGDKIRFSGDFSMLGRLRNWPGELRGALCQGAEFGTPRVELTARWGAFFIAGIDPAKVYKDTGQPIEAVKAEQHIGGQ